MRPINAMLAACAVAAGVAASGGCYVSKQQYDQTADELKTGKQELHDLREEAEGLQAVVIDQQKQIRSLQALGQKRLDTIYHVERIELSRYTGGVNLDKSEGDEAIKVYLRPMDQDSSALKAAGDIKVQLYDLAAEPNENLIGEYTWTPEQASKLWSSGFMTYHFSLECPWKSAPPKHDEITVRVEFTDYLTGKVFTAQKLCKINLPPPAQPGKQPAASTKAS